MMEVVLEETAEAHSMVYIAGILTFGRDITMAERSFRAVMSGCRGPI